MRQTKWNHYLVNLKRIGKGKLGRVYFAVNTQNNKRVAIKELVDIDTAIFEATVMLKYGNSMFLPELYDFFLLNGKAYLVMEYIEGNTLGGNFNSIGIKKSEQLSVQITINILKGLDQLHTSGFIHGDLKPKNIMIKNNHPETIKVIDFNSAINIQNDGRIATDLCEAAKICIYMINGSFPNHLDQVEILNKELESVLMKGLNPKFDCYTSAKDFIAELLPFQ